MEQATFDHDRLDAYRIARAGAREVRALLRVVPRGHGEIVDQLRRASLSVCLNTAEGAGTWLPKEKARFYRIARASGTECAAVLDYMVDQDLVKESDVAGARRSYARVVATLVKLAMSMESTTRQPAQTLPGP
jgi:four helix bundle protein